MSFAFRKRIHWRNKPLVLIISFLLLLVSGRASYKVYKSLEESRKVLSESQSKLLELEGREGFLKEELNRLSTEEGKKDELRKKFGVGYPDENLAIIVESGPSDGSVPSTGLWFRIKSFFLNLF